MRRISTRQFWLLTALIFLIATSRAIRINDFHLDNDEIWAIWQTIGTPQQVISWTSPTEHPTYFLLLDAWRQIAGMDPFVLRYLSLLLSLFGLAFMYRTVRRQHGHNAGVIAALAYSVFAISQFTSLYTRSYILAYSALPLALWLIHRYFDKPTILRAVLLSLSLTVLYVSTVTIIPVYSLLGLYTLFIYRQRIWRWWLPVLLLLILTLPDVLSNKLQSVSNHANAPRMFTLPPLPAATIEFFNYLTGTPLWFIFLALALITLIFQFRHTLKINRPRTLQLIFWSLWVVGVPILLYVLEPRLGFYTLKRYGWWYVFGIGIFIAISLARLPTYGKRLVIASLVCLSFIPFRLNNLSYIVTPLSENFKWLRDHLEANDALLIDPNITCNFPEEWDYYTHLYFPNGLRYIDTPQDARRVWYVASQDDASRQVEQELAKDHIPGRYVGPPGCFFRLYEAPPDPVGVLYPNGMRFHGAEIMDGDKPYNGKPVMREGQPFKLRLWWSVDKPVDLDYSVGLMLSLQQVISQWDSAPNIVFPEGAPHETSRWQTGQIYLEERDLQIPYPYGHSGIALNLVLYWFGDNQRLMAPGVARDGTRYLGRIEVVAW